MRIGKYPTSALMVLLLVSGATYWIFNLEKHQVILDVLSVITVYPGIMAENFMNRPPPPSWQFVWLVAILFDTTAVWTVIWLDLRPRKVWRLAKKIKKLLAATVIAWAAVTGLYGYWFVFLKPDDPYALADYQPVWFWGLYLFTLVHLPFAILGLVITLVIELKVAEKRTVHLTG